MNSIINFQVDENRHRYSTDNVSLRKNLAFLLLGKSGIL